MPQTPRSSPFRALLAALQFYTVLPLYRWCAPPSKADMTAGHSLLPVVGLLLGSCQGAVALGIAALCANPSANPSVGAALGALGAWLTPILLTRGLHEDGLADYADGILGGASVERRLAIMKDSRIGAFGVLALIADAAITTITTAIIVALAPSQVAFGVILAAAIIPRSSALLLTIPLPYLRTTEGIVSGTPLTLSPSFWIATCAGILFILTLIGLPLISLLLAVSGGVTAALYYQQKNLLGGYTGDCLGAAIKIASAAIAFTAAVGLA